MQRLLYNINFRPSVPCLFISHVICIILYLFTPTKKRFEKGSTRFQPAVPCEANEYMPFQINEVVSLKEQLLITIRQ